ncbi:MAG: bifunctional diaminohydroxyphosphoribosylaminopyrimidine deaminase/5-amino-6-(5-phosphoribosylamino)uracil reductase RibD [Phycisphaerae bacterium]|jgi:diaminohydroxyphosphoribosylaminopyrimidine deaminase/5-amino-6-(5-phosphoribosylamino)uracil reductase
MTSDEKYMRMALGLARRGVGSVEPNPAVGCVIVKDNKIIGRGWHKKFGGPHAEINALKSCKRTPRGATMYVTLEPCCHFGKTPPCTDAIIKAGIKKVVAAIKDPTKKVNGKGLEILKKAEVEVKTGVCKKEARLLNAPFFKSAKTKRPWIIIKWAQSRDGFLARTDKKRWITGAESRKDVHRLRRKVQAVLVGINTVLADDPKLTARQGTGRQPLRVVLDSQLRIPLNCNLIKTARKSPVVVFTTQRNNKKIPILKRKGIDVVTVASAGGKCRLRDVLSRLGKKNVQQILVEGGSSVIMSFLRQGLADEFCVYIAPTILDSQGRAEITGSMAKLSKAVGLHYVDIKRFGDDVRVTGFSKDM